MRRGNLFVAALVAVGAVVVGYFALGMPGMNHDSGSSGQGMVMGNERTGVMRLGVADFAARMADPMSC